jgi:hypothetical protein
VATKVIVDTAQLRNLRSIRTGFIKQERMTIETLFPSIFTLLVLSIKSTITQQILLTINKILN